MPAPPGAPGAAAAAKKIPPPPPPGAKAAAASPPPGAAPPGSSRTVQEIYAVTAQHDPKLLTTLPVMLKKMEGKEDAVLKMLKKKHGVIF